ncbi:NAD-dependent succinate-semialdehyde dehydrogenase [Nesterenkonia sp. MY13]|uniref:NAD-dependent succinate-semialdehyde dehydrogenase n=1 Tax=Nesterenkonia sedimenti TaxID=1463632 RepID=A0A7X8TIJ1_9MICC|nr:NAD-dependent succinate-semialdehyde dehydrogenase [Nesterenkonia sedimenti]NLS09396.1 NAD-dependent succinate-semialdehyde dehydrogenase [Nesterenkonia sedimenti]
MTTAVDPAAETGFRTQNPESNEVEERFDYISDAEVEQALAAAHQEYRSWSARPMSERVEIARRIADTFEEQRGELAEIISTEMGKPLNEAKAEIWTCVSIFRYYADNGPELAADKVIKHEGGFKAVLQSRPLGALLGIMPWNFPFYQIARFAAPNLILGNTILLKHAETCPQSGLAVERVFREAGLPDGAYQNVFITHDQVEPIIADARIQGVSLTGSERAGAAVAEIAGRHLKKVVLELGGSDAHIYLNADDARAAAQKAFGKRMYNMGQACTSNKRLLVAEHLYDDFLDEVTRAAGELVPGNPLKPAEGNYYPLSSEAAAVRLNEQIQRAVDQGATLHAGGGRPDQPGAYVEPTVLSGITEEMDAYHEELFGPVVMVYKVKNAEEALAIANSSPYGLGGAVFSSDRDEAQAAAEQLETGMTNVNVGGSEAADMPFGGVKRSGMGRELGPLGMDEFVNKRLLYINENETP